jgi:asparagine synthase (glutamine-hydrolysing)
VSAIFGCIYLDGRPPSTENGEAMKSAMRKWGPDGVSFIRNGSAVMGFANLAITPEAVHESLPHLDENSGVLYTASARLDNREELCEVFGIPAQESGNLPDGELVMRACREWGEGAPRHLYGDWSFAEWDSRRRTLFLARDQLGNTGLYYYHRPPLFAFASDPEGLFALKEIERRINERYTASYLAMFPLIDEHDTCWTDVGMLPAGFSLTVTPEGKKTQRYWDMKGIPTAEGMGDDEYVAGFLERYRTAVEVRLRSRRPVGATLSAGLDSGSVTALAAQALQKSGLPLTAFTSVPFYPSGHLVPGLLADEWPFAGAVAGRYGNIEHCAVDAASVSPLNGIERAVAVTHSPQHAAVNEYWIMAMHDAARERGIGVMLTGQLGNGGVSWSGGRDRIYCLFAAGKWDEGMRAMAEWKRRHGRSWTRTIAGRLVKPFILPHLKRCREMLKPNATPWTDYSAINPAFAARLGLREAMKTAGCDATFSRVIDPLEERRLTLVRNGTWAGPIWHVTGAAFGMEVRDPTADIRLLEFCLGVPDEQDTFAGGERMLIRRAMEGILPPEVQWNKTRGRQAADVAFRLLNHSAEMDAVLARLDRHPHVPRYLDLRLMRSVWHELQAGVTGRTAGRVASILLRGIMCGCFIDHAGRTKNMKP